MHDDDPPTLPSIDIVRAEVDAVTAEQERRGQSFDSKAGFLLGISGVLIGLAAKHPDVLQIIGQVIAAFAAAAAVGAMLPRTSAGLDLKGMRDKYLDVAPAWAKLRMLDTRIYLYKRDDEQLAKKVHWIKVSIGLIALAVVLLVTGSIVDYWAGEPG